MSAADFERRGLAPREARRAAERMFGNVALLQDRGYDVRGAGLPERIAQDIRHAARVLGKQPAFTALAVLTLALGIGAAMAIFSVVYGVLLKPLPFHEADRLVALNHRAPGFGVGGPVNPGPADYLRYRDNGRVFEDVGLSTGGRVSLIRNGAPEQVQALRVTDGLLPLLRVRPELGRLIQEEDDVPDAPLRVLLTYGGWHRTFGGDKNVVGRSLVIDTRPHEIIGVLPASFKFLNRDPEVILPLRLNRAFPGSLATGGSPGSSRARRSPKPTTTSLEHVAGLSLPIGHRHVDGRRRRLIQPITSFVPDDADDLEPLTGNASDPLAERLGRLAPVLACKILRNDHDFCTLANIGPREAAPGDDRVAHRFEVAGSVNRDVPLGNVRTLDDIMARSMAQTSFAMVILAIAATMALLLAVVGLYGVVSHIAAERTHEIGIHMALGAERGDVVGLFVRQGLVVTLTGVALGISAAMFLTPIMAALLYGVGPTDPVTYAAVSIGLSGVALLATYLPARRASDVEPVIALRSLRT